MAEHFRDDQIAKWPIHRAPAPVFRVLQHHVHDEGEHVLRGVVARGKQEDQQVVQLGIVEPTRGIGGDQRIDHIVGIATAIPPPLDDEVVHELPEHLVGRLQIRQHRANQVGAEALRLERFANAGNGLRRGAHQTKHHRNGEIRGELGEIESSLRRPFIQQPRHPVLHQRPIPADVSRCKRRFDAAADPPMLRSGLREHQVVHELAPGRPLGAHDLRDRIHGWAKFVVHVREISYGLVLMDDVAKIASGQPRMLAAGRLDVRHGIDGEGGALEGQVRQCQFADYLHR